MNKKIVIDPGHGGSDNGASGNGIIEKNLTLDISKYMYDELRKLGIPVMLTRDSDETLNPTERVNRILSSFGDNPDVIVISNHINAGGGDGAEVIYALRNNNTLSNLILNNIENAGQNVRKVYQRRLPSNPSQDYYFIHRNTGKTEPIIIEYGFLDSKGDDVNQLKNNYKNYVDAVVNALKEYIGIPTNNNTYTVKQGDTLYSIAKKFNTSIDMIKNINNLTNNILSINQVLILPENETIKTDTYIVKKGDNLYSISKRFNTTQKELMDLNNLTSNLLSIGQILKIPTTTEKTYIVKQGDTLYKISKEFNTTIDNIKSKNNLTSNTLSIGQIIKI